MLALAEQNGVGRVARTLYSAASEIGLYARAYVKSLMFAPPANRTRCLFVVWVDLRQREQGVAKAYVSSEGFEQFYGIYEADVAAAFGGVGYVMLDQAGAERAGARLRQLMAGKRSE